MLTNSTVQAGGFPKLAGAAAGVALLLALYGFVSAFHHVFLLFSAIVPAIAAFSILQRRVWGAYGFALFELVQATVVLLLLRSTSIAATQIAAAVIMGFGLASLFFLAGRKLSAAGAKRGSPLLWIALCCLFSVPLIFFRAYAVPSGAMEDTLLIGDCIVVRVFPRVPPTRGDIIVFRYPIDRRQIFIKRVIGVPGDRIRIVSGVVYRNGIAVAEPYAVYKFNRMDKYSNNFPPSVSAVPASLGSAVAYAAQDMLRNHVVNGELVVPDGKYFVLGDSRDNSLDSRYWGFLDRADLIGQPIFIYDSEIPRTEVTDKAGVHRVRWSRILKVL